MGKASLQKTGLIKETYRKIELGKIHQYLSEKKIRELVYVRRIETI